MAIAPLLSIIHWSAKWRQLPTGFRCVNVTCL